MASEPGDGELRIGNALKEARRRAGMDIRTAEERTKIRTRYLRALESEEWGTLPGPAYVKGFLRTYARLLGLDADALVDEYRRSVEGAQASPVPLGDGVLETRQRLGEPGPPRRGPGRALVIGGLVGVVLVILLVLGLTSSDDEAGEGERERERRADRRERSEANREGNARRGGRRDRQRQRQAPKRVSIRLVSNTDGLQVCLLGDGERPLIDGVLGSAGSEDEFEAKRFALRFPFGYDRNQFDLFVNGERERLEELQGPAAFAIEPPDEVRQLDPPGQPCP